MNKPSQNVLVIAVIISLVIGGALGFVAGVASTKVGKAFFKNLFQDEMKADLTHPQQLVRDGFELEYPSNWKIDTEDSDYDPDHMFSIESPGNAFVMFVIGAGETQPEEILQIQIRQFEKLMSNTSMERFERYGRLSGKGAVVKGKILGSSTTVKLFAFNDRGQTLMITEQCPDEDLIRVKDGFALIEKSFVMKRKKDAE